MVRMSPKVWIPRVLLGVCALAPFAVAHLVACAPTRRASSTGARPSPVESTRAVESSMASTRAATSADATGSAPRTPPAAAEPEPPATPTEIAKCKTDLANIALFLRTHRRCSSAAGCAVATTGCGLGGACGVGLAKSGEAGLREVLDQFENDGCDAKLPPLPCPSCPSPPAPACRAGSCQP